MRYLECAQRKYSEKHICTRTFKTDHEAGKLFWNISLPLWICSAWVNGSPYVKASELEEIFSYSRVWKCV